MRKIPTILLLTLTIFLVGSANGQLAPNNSSSLLNNSSTNKSHPQPLLPEQAFPYYVSIVSPTELRVTWEVSPDHYLYRNQFHFALVDAETEEQIEVDYTLPEGKPKTDQFFGAVEVYYERVSATIEFSRVPRSSVHLLIQYQGCADWGFCYPPQSTQYQIGL